MKRKKVTKADGNISDDVADCNEKKLSTDGYFASSSSIQFQTVEVSQNVTLQLPFRTGTDTTVAVNDYPL
ncbi:hypothetical protein Tco_0947371 [Tanacetum coccineum]